MSFMSSFSIEVVKFYSVQLNGNSNLTLLRKFHDGGENWAKLRDLST